MTRYLQTLLLALASALGTLLMTARADAIGGGVAPAASQVIAAARGADARDAEAAFRTRAPLSPDRTVRSPRRPWAASSSAAPPCPAGSRSRA